MTCVASASATSSAFFLPDLPSLQAVNTSLAKASCQLLAGSPCRCRPSSCRSSALGLSSSICAGHDGQLRHNPLPSPWAPCCPVPRYLRLAQPARIARGFITCFCLLTHIKALSMLSSSSCFPNTWFSCSMICISYLSILHDSGIILLRHSYNHITSHFSSAPKPQLSKPVLLSRLSKPGLPLLAPSPPLAGCCLLSYA